MMQLSSQPDRFLFRPRPIPIPGDMRIGWRVALILLMLGHSRSKQASLAKLHILNDALRSERPEERLETIVRRRTGLLPWVLRVEPAFARAIDFVIGEQFAEWTHTSNHTGLRLTPLGIRALDHIESDADVLTSERDLLARYAKTVSEGAVSDILGTARRAT